MQPIPQQRIVEKLDAYMAKRDYAGAERHLLYWLDEACAEGDERGELMVRNELVGHFRKTGDRDRALMHGEEALRLVNALGFERTISAGTTYTNVATACNAFGENERSLELFRKAAEIYEGTPGTDPRLLGGLYNNMALTCVALGRFAEADALYDKALATMAQVENGELEQAITYLNRADAILARAQAEAKAQSAQGKERASAPIGSAETSVGGGIGRETSAADGTEDAEDETAIFAAAACEDAIAECLDAALELLDTPSIPHDGYYAFVCEKCAPAFAFHGYFLADEDLRQRAKEIYERP